MHFAQLSVVKQRVVLGAPLPFNVRGANTALLLARGHVIDSSEQMHALLTRGALVDIEELRVDQAEVASARPEALPALWSQCMADTARVLCAAPAAGFAQTLDRAA